MALCLKITDVLEKVNITIDNFTNRVDSGVSFKCFHKTPGLKRFLK